MLKNLLNKYMSVILYGVFGVLTTLVNIASYYLLYDILHIPNVASTSVAWLFAVLFAFVVNKRYVFNSISWNRAVVLREARDFFACRVLTGLLDVAIMYVAVDLLSLNPLAWKFFSNLLVIILNYIASKFIIFKTKG